MEAFELRTRCYACGNTTDPFRMIRLCEKRNVLRSETYVSAVDQRHHGSAIISNAWEKFSEISWQYTRIARTVLLVTVAIIEADVLGDIFETLTILHV